MQCGVDLGPPAALPLSMCDTAADAGLSLGSPRSLSLCWNRQRSKKRSRGRLGAPLLTALITPAVVSLPSWSSAVVMRCFPLISEPTASTTGQPSRRVSAVACSVMRKSQELSPALDQLYAGVKVDPVEALSSQPLTSSGRSGSLWRHIQETRYVLSDPPLDVLCKARRVAELL